MGKLTGKVAVVTGASKGIGAGIAKALAAEGAAVAVNFASDRAGAERVVAEIEKGGGKAFAVQGDTSKAADVARVFAAAREAFGRPSVVVNNAGVFSFGPFEEGTEESFRRHYDVNVLGPLLVVGEALKHFGPEGGSVVNVSSVAATSPPPGGVIYSSTKGALDTITLGLARELAPRKIRVNGVSPGYTETEGAKSITGIDDAIIQQFVAQTPLGRAGQPLDIAKVAVFLASDDSAWITGETLRAAGGQR
ncbi:SDR family NAD(P)-dependent oxidoreductase [Paludisphaera mucosa]|uniref:Glucose 1-dehydrogenase n=1 Tax=Paludisphaera mucosa TaxID=3030827 RepID=A0ABT6FBD8_9BACT|nr:glucose 1-dehydrogenase [Paludisphaera mucosa]MDG3004887.1 glucose 1-dehydrogenase [Paludisphaera mucosa]